MSGCDLDVAALENSRTGDLRSLRVRGQETRAQLLPLACECGVRRPADNWVRKLQSCFVDYCGVAAWYTSLRFDRVLIN